MTDSSLVLEELSQTRLRLDKMEQQLTSIQEQLSLIIRSTERMGCHINNVENAYSTLRAPLNYVRDRVNYIIGGSVPELPQLPSPED